MVQISEVQKKRIRSRIANQLIHEGVFWSYAKPLVSKIPDNLLIEKVLIHSDIPEINNLFKVYSRHKIEAVWRHQLLPQLSRYRGLNRFLAWAYFKKKDPDQFINQAANKIINARLNPANGKNI